MEESGSMELVKSSMGRVIAFEYFTAQPFVRNASVIVVTQLKPSGTAHMCCSP